MTGGPPDREGDGPAPDGLETHLDVRAFADTAPAVLWVTDPSGACTFLSRAWYELTGQTEATALGYGWTDAVHPDDREKSTATFLDANARREAFELDYRLRDGDGRYRRAIDAGRPRFAADGTFLGFVGSVIDITERHELEEQLRQAQKMEALGRLAGGIAHDFNNLLTVIRGYASVLRERLAPGADGTEELNEISAAADRAAELTQQLLAIGRKQALRPIVIDLNAAIRESESLLRRLVERHITVVLELFDAPIPVRIDRGQLVQVLLNLVVNGRDAMPQGGVLTLKTGQAERDAAGVLPSAAYAMLSVSDTGTGIAEDVRPHIFDPFFTTKDVGKGTGLGLATVYAIVKQSNGHVDVESTPGRGTTFHICLPLVDQTSS